MTWRRARDKSLKSYWTQTRSLGNDYYLRGVIYPARNGEYYLGLHAYKGRFGHLFYRGGHPTGPGGVAVLSPALEMLNDAEWFVFRREDIGFLTVWAESLRLYMVYRKVLAKRGYVESAEFPEEWGPEMTKRI